MTDWKPIQTAPKDKHILGYLPQYGVGSMFWQHVRTMVDPYDGGVWLDMYGWRIHGMLIQEDHENQPTHWQPLPAPPGDCPRLLTGIDLTPDKLMHQSADAIETFLREHAMAREQMLEEVLVIIGRLYSPKSTGDNAKGFNMAIKSALSELCVVYHRQPIARPEDYAPQ